MSYPLYLVDAFSLGPFTGNPAAVCILPGPADPQWMQRVGMEMNQAETAFVHPQGDVISLRWFTPTVEVDLCGHATLAAAHVLFERGIQATELRFSTKSGILTASRAGDEIELDFPSEPPENWELPHRLESLGADPVWSGRNRMDWLVQLSHPDQIRNLRPDFAEIAALGLRGLIVTSVGDCGYDFVSRGFFPQSGIDEDAVTGSAHCALAPYWASRLGRNSMTGYQASRRGGVVKVQVAKDRVKLRGRATTTFEGTLLIPSG